MGTRIASHPLRWICAFYVSIALAGGAVLSLPQAVSPELRFEEGDYFYKRVLNAMFTSASAVTLTGLTVLDTGRDFSRFGQGVVLGLMQIGGLAAMVIGGLVAMRGIAPACSASTAGPFVWRWARFVIVLFLSVEVAGAAAWALLVPAATAPLSERVFAGLFHAASAWCNAGLTLSSDSVVRLRGAWPLYVVILPLVVAGGFGALVWRELINGGATRPCKRILGWTAGLVPVSAGVFWLAESWSGGVEAPPLPPEVAALMPPVMRDMSPVERAPAAVFQTLSARSAGFHTVALDVGSISSAGAAVLGSLMLIGGAPGSTAGGVGIPVLALLALSMIRRAARPRKGKVISAPLRRDDRRAYLLIGLMLGLVLLASLALRLTERGAHTQEILFESASALSNSGLSMGLTPRLSIFGRVALILAMLTGRVINVGLAAALWSAFGDAVVRPSSADAPTPNPASV